MISQRSKREPVGRPSKCASGHVLLAQVLQLDRCSLRSFIFLPFSSTKPGCARPVYLPILFRDEMFQVVAFVVQCL